MKRAIFGLAAFAAGGAFAQTDPSIDDILAPEQPAPETGAPAAPAGPSELDELSLGTAGGDFPSFEAAARRKPVSVTLRALDKIIAKYADIVIPMDGSATFGTLTITARFCDKRPPEEFPETTAFIEIVDSTPPQASNLKIPDPKRKPGAVKSAPAPESAGGHDGALSPAPEPSAAGLPDNAIFSGWMFASSPALSALQHPVYDVWVIDCKTVKADS